METEIRQRKSFSRLEYEIDVVESRRKLNENDVFFSSLVDCNMAAAVSPEWQRLSKVKPAEIDFTDESREDQNEKLGVDFTRVSRSRKKPKRRNFQHFFQLNSNEFDNVDDLKLAMRLGQQFVKVKPMKKLSENKNVFFSFFEQKNKT